MNNLRIHIDNGLKKVLVFLMAILLIDVCWQVFSRYVLQDPSSFTDELARYLLIWVTLIGAAFMTGQGKHLSIDLWSSSFSRKRQALISNSAIFVFALFVMMIGGLYLSYITLSLEQKSATLQIPLGYIYLAIPISGALMMFYAIVNILEAFQGEKA